MVGRPVIPILFLVLLPLLAACGEGHPHGDHVAAGAGELSGSGDDHTAVEHVGAGAGSRHAHAAGAQTGEGGDHEHDHDAAAHHRFDDVERWVEVFDSPERDAWQKPQSVVEFLGVQEGEVVADLGAGTGYFTVHLAGAVGVPGRVYAVDIESTMVDYLEERAQQAGLGQVTPVLAAPDDPKLPEAGVDLIFICDTWHHIDDRLVYLGRLERALRTGGTVAVVDFREGELPVGPPPGSKLSRAEVVAEFEEAGWSLASESDALPYQYVLVFTPPR